MKIFFSALLSFIIFQAGCIAQPSSDPSLSMPLSSLSDQEIQSLLVGTWYGERPEEDGELYEFISLRRPDGTYTVLFRVSKEGEILDEFSETGYWRVSEGYYQTSVRASQDESGKLTPIFGVGPFIGFNYRIISLNQKEFEYEETTLEMSFKAVRVADGYKFSPIDRAERAKEKTLSDTLARNPGPSEIPEFTDDVHEYINTIGGEYIGFFNQICSATDLRLDAILDKMQELGWQRVNEGARPDEYHWISAGVDEIIGHSGTAPFILVVLPDQTRSEETAKSCDLTMFGISPHPEIGKIEVDIFKSMLEKSYIVGNTKTLSEGSVDSKGEYVAELYQYSTELKKDGNSEVFYGYLWVGGAHKLRAFTGSAVPNDR